MTTDFDICLEFMKRLQENFEDYNYTNVNEYSVSHEGENFDIRISMQQIYLDQTDLIIVGLSHDENTPWVELFLNFFVDNKEVYRRVDTFKMEASEEVGAIDYHSLIHDLETLLNKVVDGLESDDPSFYVTRRYIETDIEEALHAYDIRNKEEVRF